MRQETSVGTAYRRNRPTSRVIGKGKTSPLITRMTLIRRGGAKTRANRHEIAEEIRTSLFDLQTAGGLLLSVARSDSAELLDTLKGAGVPAVEIGEVLPQGKPMIGVV
jgi:selenophosphate synthase